MAETATNVAPFEAQQQSGQLAAQTPKMGALAPQNFEEAMRFADMMAGSNIVPKDYQGNPGNILVAVQWGSEIGLPPLQAMQNIAVINGRPALWGDAMIALVRGSGIMEKMVEEIEGEGKDAVAYCTVKRRGEDETTREFSMKEAETAGLTGKQGPWKQYPRRMLQLRARAFALRDVFPDVLRGVHIAEEVQDMPREMRDVTPEDEKDDPAPKNTRAKTSRTSSVRDKVKNRRQAQQEEEGADAPDLNTMLQAMQAARTEEELQAAGARAGEFTGDDREKARKAYGDRLITIRQQAKIDRIDGDLRQVSGSDVEAVMESYSKELNEIESDDNEAYQRLMDLADERAKA